MNRIRKRHWLDVAAMKLVMVRMDEAEQRLRTEVNESSFTSSKEIVQHEASILSGLMQAMTTESYGYADDPEFREMAQKITDSGTENAWRPPIVETSKTLSSVCLELQAAARHATRGIQKPLRLNVIRTVLVRITLLI